MLLLIDNAREFSKQEERWIRVSNLGRKGVPNLLPLSYAAQIGPTQKHSNLPY